MEANIFEFRNVFYKIIINFNYILRDPIKGLNDTEKDLVYKYIKEYHDSDSRLNIQLMTWFHYCQKYF